MTGPTTNPSWPWPGTANGGSREKAYGFNLIYSGNFAIDIETDTRAAPGC